MAQYYGYDNNQGGMMGRLFGNIPEVTRNLFIVNALMFIATLINQFVLGLLINSYFISMLYGSPYKALLATRVVQSLILTVVQTAGILVLAKVLQRVKPSLPAMER